VQGFPCACDPTCACDPCLLACCCVWCSVGCDHSNYLMTGMPANAGQAAKMRWWCTCACDPPCACDVWVPPCVCLGVLLLLWEGMCCPGLVAAVLLCGAARAVFFGGLRHSAGVPTTLAFSAAAVFCVCVCVRTLLHVWWCCCPCPRASVAVWCCMVGMFVATTALLQAPNPLPVCCAVSQPHGSRPTSTNEWTARAG
jgi:hypothetical protein